MTKDSVEEKFAIPDLPTYLRNEWAAAMLAFWTCLLLTEPTTAAEDSKDKKSIQYERLLALYWQEEKIRMWFLFSHH